MEYWSVAQIRTPLLQHSITPLSTAAADFAV
jgi:hypothetical protein